MVEGLSSIQILMYNKFAIGFCCFVYVKCVISRCTLFVTRVAEKAFTIISLSYTIIIYLTLCTINLP